MPVMLALSEVNFFSCVEDRKSTRLNSSHANISYAVFCLKKKKKTKRKKEKKKKKNDILCSADYPTENHNL